MAIVPANPLKPARQNPPAAGNLGLRAGLVLEIETHTNLQVGLVLIKYPLDTCMDIRLTRNHFFKYFNFILIVKIIKTKNM